MDENKDFLSQGSDNTKKETPKKKTSSKKEEKVEKVDVVETVEVIAVDVSKIENALVKRNVTEEAIAQLKTFLDLKVNGIADKEGYKLADESRKICKKIRGLTKEVCQEGRAAAIAEQKAWIAKEKEITGEIEAVEEYLEGQLKVIDDEKKRIKEEQDIADQLRIQKRTARLLDLGMTLQGDNYMLESHIINALHVKVYSDFEFEGLVAPVEVDAKRIAEEKAAEATKLAELQAQQAKEREEFEAQRREFEEQQRLAKEKTDAEAKVLADQQAKLLADQEALAQAKIKARKTSLFALGLSQQHEKLVFHEVGVGEDEIIGLDETQWLSLLHHITEEVAKVKVRIEEETKTKIQAEKNAAVEAERKKIEAEQKAKDEAAAKAKAEAEAKIKKEEEEKLRLATLAPDQEKYDLFLKSLQALVIPDFTTDDYKEFGKYMQETRDRMVNHFNKEKLTRIK